MKIKLIETCIKENAHFADAGVQTSRSESEIRAACPVSKTSSGDHPWDVEANLINIHPDMLFQEILGFGGTINGAAAKSWQKMSEEKRREVMTAYFDGENGIGYNFARISIGSCDFCEKEYSYTNEGDMTLDSFSIEPDRDCVIPFIKEALKLSPDIYFLSSPWSPPKYMKTNGSLIGGALREECYGLFAKYVRKYVDAYKKEGIKIWGVTAQNEPRHEQIWESCLYSPEEERRYILKFLAPSLSGTDTKIICYDHCKERLYERAVAMYGDSEGAQACAGIAYHSYSGDHFGESDLVSRRFPDKYIINSEGCLATENTGCPPDSISYGEHYAHNLCGSLYTGLNAYIDWCLSLDEHNGPFHNRDGRGCNAISPVFCDSENDTVTYLSPYYYIGHFSKFIHRGARRVGSSSHSEALEQVAFKNPDGTLVCVILNRTDNAIKYTLRLGTDVCNFVSKPHSIATALIYSE